MILNLGFEESSICHDVSSVAPKSHYGLHIRRRETLYLRWKRPETCFPKRKAGGYTPVRGHRKGPSSIAVDSPFLLTGQTEEGQARRSGIEYHHAAILGVVAFPWSRQPPSEFVELPQKVCRDAVLGQIPVRSKMIPYAHCSEDLELDCPTRRICVWGCSVPTAGGSRYISVPISYCDNRFAESHFGKQASLPRSPARLSLRLQPQT